MWYATYLDLNLQYARVASGSCPGLGKGPKGWLTGVL